jgi:hypothetical protein
VVEAKEKEAKTVNGNSSGKTIKELVLGESPAATNNSPTDI